MMDMMNQAKKPCLEITEKLYFIENFSSNDELNKFILDETQAQKYMDDYIRAITISDFISDKNKLKLIDSSYLKKTDNSILIELRCHRNNYSYVNYQIGGSEVFLDNLKTNYLPYLDNIYHYKPMSNNSEYLYSISKFPSIELLNTLSYTQCPEYNHIVNIKKIWKAYLTTEWEGIGFFLTNQQKIFRPTAHEVLSQIPKDVYEKNKNKILLIFVQIITDCKFIGKRDIGKITVALWDDKLPKPELIAKHGIVI
jgi:hypothetical protein